jgi:reductive dehalogenase
MSRKVKEFGKYLGATKVRITKLKQEWVYSHYSGRLGEGLEGKPVDDMDYEYVICMAVQHDLDMKKIGRGCAAEAEDGVRYNLASWMSIVMAEFIRCIGFRARSLPTENAPYLVVPTFVDAGMGEQGRHSIVVSKDIGCHWRPAAVATDIPLAIDKPVDFGLQAFCEKCKLCAEYCPSGSVSFEGKKVARGVKKWDADIESCRSYNQHLGHNCGICQAVCPYNHKSSLLHNTVREIIQRAPWMNGFMHRAYKLFYGPYKRAKVPDWMTTPGYFKED